MNDAATSPARVDRLAPVLVAGLAFAVAAWASRPYAVGVFHDDGVYAVLAKSLATGQGYRYLHLPGAPSAVHYPPGYPAVLAVLWRLAPEFPANIAVMLLANALFLAVTAIGVHQFARRVLGWPNGGAAAAAIVATLSYPLLMLSSLVLSEPLFVAGLFPVLIAAERVARDDDRPAAAILVGVGAGLLALVRTHAAAAALALILVLVMRRRWRSAILVVAGVGLALAPWQIWVATHGAGLAGPLQGSYGSYGAWLAEGARGGGVGFVAHTVWLNLRESGLLLADRFALRDSVLVRSITGWVVALLIVVGVARTARRAPVTVAFAAVYFAVLLAWPYTPWRFFFAVWPLLVLFIGESARYLFSDDLGLGRAARPAGVLALSLVGFGALREETRAYRSRAWRQAGDAATEQIAPVIRWVTASTSRNDVVAVEGEQLVYLFTGRHALPLASFTASEYVRPPTAAEGAAALERIVSQFPVSYVLTISPPVLASADLLEQRGPSVDGSASARLVRVGRLPGGGVFRVDHP